VTASPGGRQGMITPSFFFFFFKKKNLLFLFI
jgi:hypothetical protein